MCRHRPILHFEPALRGQPAIRRHAEKSCRARSSPAAIPASATRRIPSRASASCHSTARACGCGSLPRSPATENPPASTRTRTPAAPMERTPQNMRARAMRSIRCVVNAHDEAAARQHPQVLGACRLARGAIGQSNSVPAIELSCRPKSPSKHLRAGRRRAKLRHAFLQKGRPQRHVLRPRDRPVESRQTVHRLPNSYRAAIQFDAPFKHESAPSEAPPASSDRRRVPQSHNPRSTLRRAPLAPPRLPHPKARRKYPDTNCAP